MFRRSLPIVVGESLIRLGLLGVVAVLAYTLDKPMLQRTTALLLIYTTATELGTLNLHQAAVFFVASATPTTQRARVAQLLLVMTATALAAGLFILSAGQLFSSIQSVQSALWPLCLAVIFEIPTRLVPQVFIAVERLPLVASYDTAVAALQYIAILLPALLGFDIDIIAWALALHALLRLGGGLIMLHRVLPPGALATASRAELISFLRYAGPLALAVGTAVANRQFDKWLVGIAYPNEIDGFFIASQELPIISLVGYAVSSSLAVQFVRAFASNQITYARQLWFAQTSRMMLFVAPVAAAVVAFAPLLITIIASDKYRSYALILAVYNIILFHRVAEYGLVMRAAGDTRGLLVTTLVYTGVNVTLSLTLIWWLGPLGTALGTVIGAFASWMYSLTRISRALSCRMRDVFPWKLFRRTSSVALALALPSAALSTPFGKLAALGGIAGFAALYVGLAHALRFVKLVTPIPAEPGHE